MIMFCNYSAPLAEGAELERVTSDYSKSRSYKHKMLSLKNK